MSLILTLNQFACHSKKQLLGSGSMNPYQCHFHRNKLTNPYYSLTKIHSLSLLTLWRTWNCWRQKIKPKCDQNIWKLKITSKTENNIKKRLNTIFSIPNERGSFNKRDTREYEDECIENEGETDASTHFLRIEKINWLI